MAHLGHACKRSLSAALAFRLVFMHFGTCKFSRGLLNMGGGGFIVFCILWTLCIGLDPGPEQSPRRGCWIKTTKARICGKMPHAPPPFLGLLAYPTLRG